MTAKEYFRLLFILHIALVVGQLVFLFISVFLVLSGTMEAVLAGERNLFLIIVSIVAIGGVYAGNYLYNKQLNSIKKLGDFKEQFNKVKTLVITRLALLEGLTILSIVFYLLTGSWMFLLLSMFLLLLFLKLKPNKGKIILELELSDETIKLLEDPTTIIADKTYDN